MVLVQDYSLISNFICESFGLQLSKEIKPIAKSKIAAFSKKYSVEDWSDFFKKERSKQRSKKILELVDIFLVGHTSFFRDPVQFQVLTQNVLPALVGSERDWPKEIDLRIWSAGCSSGEEPYSILFTLMNYFGPKYQNIECGVLATDISKSSLEVAKKGCYSLSRIAKNYRQEYSKYIRRVDEDLFEIAAFVKKEALFRQFNLNSENLPFRKKFHIIFCRNVLIYFEKKQRDLIALNITNQIEN